MPQHVVELVAALPTTTMTERRYLPFTAELQERQIAVTRNAVLDVPTPESLKVAGKLS